MIANPDIALDGTVMEAPTSATSKTSETEVLLTVIIDELKRIGSTLARQDERIEALSRAKNRSQLPDWNAGLVVVKLLKL